MPNSYRKSHGSRFMMVERIFILRHRSFHAGGQCGLNAVLHGGFRSYLNLEVNTCGEVSLSTDTCHARYGSHSQRHRLLGSTHGDFLTSPAFYHQVLWRSACYSRNVWHQVQQISIFLAFWWNSEKERWNRCLGTGPQFLLEFIVGPYKQQAPEVGCRCIPGLQLVDCLKICQDTDQSSGYSVVQVSSVGTSPVKSLDDEF